jgi:hypothetical protein
MSLTLLRIDLSVSFLRYHILFSIRLHVTIPNTYLEHMWRNRKTRTRGDNSCLQFLRRKSLHWTQTLAYRINFECRHHTPMTRVYFYQERENSQLEGQNHIFLPPQECTPSWIRGYLFRKLPRFRNHLTFFPGILHNWFWFHQLWPIGNATGVADEEEHAYRKYLTNFSKFMLIRHSALPPEAIIRWDKHHKETYKNKTKQKHLKLKLWQYTNSHKNR